MSRSTSETVADTNINNNNNNNNSNRLNVNSYSSSLTSSSSPGSASIVTSNATGSHQLNNTTSLTTPNGALTNNSNTISHLNSTSYASSSAANTANMTPQTSHTLNSTALTNSEKKKIGHREVKHGIVLYKKVPTDELKKSIQFGIVHFINERNRDKMDRDLLMQDFQVVENIVFPRAGSQCTPAHDFNDFKLKVYAPYGFKYLRRKFNLNEVDFMVSFYFLVC